MGARARKTPARWVVLALAAYGVAVVAVLLVPLSYSEIVQAIGDWIRSVVGDLPFGDGWIEFSANILMFAPLGALLTLALRRPWRGVALAIVLSAGAELAQLVIPSRHASPRDLAANVLGAALGAALAWWLVVRRERRASAPPLAQTLDRADQRVPPGVEPGAPGNDLSH